MSDAPNPTILVVEDDPAQRSLVTDVLAGAGFTVQAVEGIAAALDAISAASLQLVLSAFKLGDGNGLALLQEIRIRRPALSFVLVTVYGSIGHAVDAIRAGADDYLDDVAGDYANRVDRDVQRVHPDAVAGDDLFVGDDPDRAEHIDKHGVGRRVGVDHHAAAQHVESHIGQFAAA